MSLARRSTRTGTSDARAGAWRPCLALSAGASRGWLKLGGLTFPCALGRAGCRARKREGDGATPIGPLAHARGPLSPRPRAASAHAPAGEGDPPARRLVRRAGRPQLQSARAPSLSGQRGAAVAGGRALRRRRRAGLQRPSPRARARQRHLHARGKARIRADRGLHRARASASVAPARAAGVAVGAGCAGRHKKAPEAFASGVRSTYRGSGVLRQAARSDGARTAPQTSLSSCKRARRDRRGRGPRAPGRCRAAGPPAPSRS